MNEWLEFIKGVIRPFIIVWGCVIYGLCVLAQIDPPMLLVGLVTAVIAEYVGERAIKRLSEK